MKQFLFRYYGYLAIVGGLGALLVSWLVGWLDKAPVVGSVIATALAFVYFVQRQKLEETKLFHELFCEFNRRYDRMNSRLAKISVVGVTSDEDRNKLVDYFNLCAEEYMYFQLGYIFPEVWTSWCRGMLQYVSKGNGTIRQVWTQELESGSYYGLTLEVVETWATEMKAK